LARRTFLAFLVASAIFVQPRAQQGRPNIVFIVADDLGYADVGFTGGTEIRTPSLDALAAAGARLDQFYAQPVCSPTRAALMTGRYPMRHGLQVGVVRPWAQYGLPLDERTLPQALKDAGYVTALAGKWHLGHFDRAYLPTARGFDRQYGHYNGAIDYFTHVRDGGFDWHRNDRVSRDEGYSTHLIAQEAVRFIREVGGRTPFFLDVSFNAVHAPLQVPDRYKETYAHLKEPRRTYAGMVAAMDEAVGQIAAALDEKGLRENTLIVFSSDNGGPQPGTVTDNGRLRAGKATLYEGGVRVAAFASWTGRIRPGTVVGQPLHMVDWYPTLLTLAGVRLAQTLPLDGRDAWPTIALGKPFPRGEILINASPGAGAIRVGDWKLVLNGGYNEVPDIERGGKRAGNPTVELFNLADDPYEQKNVADANPERLKVLRARYDALASQAVAPKIRLRPADFAVPSVWGEPVRGKGRRPS
jgi:arylsulfatase A-like enzyme